jgi:hypothetical protein
MDKEKSQICHPACASTAGTGEGALFSDRRVSIAGSEMLRALKTALSMTNYRYPLLALKREKSTYLLSTMAIE